MFSFQGGLSTDLRRGYTQGLALQKNECGAQTRIIQVQEIEPVPGAAA